MVFVQLLGAACCLIAAGWCSGETVYYELDPPVLKPGGETFQSWKNQTAFSRTYHVDTQSPAASDNNPGTKDKPFKTISRAAQILEAGQNVVVHAGVYRETIRPMNGGTSPSQMIGYLADGDVIVKGSEVVGPQWDAVDPAAHIWALDLSRVAFAEGAPFDTDNVPDESFKIMSWATALRGKTPYTLPRGMVFQEGRRLLRVSTLGKLQETEGAHWTDRAAGKLFVQPFEGKNPNDVTMEVTVRSAGFRPAVRGLGFIHLKGFTFEQFGNGFPRPQEGAISVGAGHHWLIEENTVRQVNGIGIDIGSGWYGGSVKPQEPGEGTPEWHIVRQNLVADTGVCGIAGHPTTHALIEDNVLRNCTLYPVEMLYESAGIKTHRTVGTLIRRNLILDSSVNGVWMDWDTRDSRCTQNVVVNAAVGIFVEASVMKPYTLIDRNIVWNTREGLIEQDSTHQIFVHNLVGRSSIGVNLKGKVSDRPITLFNWTSAGGNQVAANAFWQVKTAVRSGPVPEKRPQVIADNLTEANGVIVSYDASRGMILFSATQPPAPARPDPRVTHDFFGREWSPHSAGPFELTTQPIELRFDRWRKWSADTQER